MTLPELPWIATAKSLLGVREIGSTNKGVEIEKWATALCGGKPPSYIYPQPWCGTFVAHCLQKNGFTKGGVNCRKVGYDKKGAGANKYPLNWYGAGDYAKEAGFKLKKPCYGCVAVKTRKGGGHVAFVVGRDKKTGKLVCLGGNQSNMVCFALYSESDFEAFMWYGRTSNPAQGRYDLPLISGITATKVTEA